jgi:hypothetical protein
MRKHSHGEHGPDIKIKEFQSRNYSMKVAANPGMMLLGIWLVLTGLVRLANLNFEGMALIMDILAIAAGALLLMNR